MSILSQKYKDYQFIQGNRPDGITTEQAIENLIDIKTKYTWSTGADDALDMAIKALEQEPKWIPVSERLPEDMTYVLTTIQINSKRVRVRSGNYYHGFFNNDNGDVWNAADEEVTAWMPLPEPYKAESEDKE